MQQSSFIGVLLARHVSGDFAHHQERRPVLQHVVFCTQFRCVAVAVLVTPKHTDHSANFLDNRTATQQNWA
jgi:hypothetical protein